MVQQTRRFGPPIGAPGIEVIENSGNNSIPDPRYGTVAFYGILKRGPMGVAIPVNSRRKYDSMFGDPQDPRWHLYADGSQLTPDAIDGFFSTGGGAGSMLVTRLDLDGKARKASVTIKNRVGADALLVTAANEGKWGGAKNSIPYSPLIVSTARTFTIVAPGVESNEFIGAIAEFNTDSGKQYNIVANTPADPVSGEVVFTIGAQYNLLIDGVSGPTTLTGTASYHRYTTLTGTVTFPLTIDITGTVQINNTVITGTGTTFTTDFAVGHNVYYNGEARLVESITSDTTLTINSAFSSDGSNATIQKDNLVVTGTGTQFQTEVVVGDVLYANINNELIGRTVAAIATNTSLTLTSGFPAALSGATTIEKANYTITGTGSQFNTQVSPGQYIIDPNRAGKSLKVVSVTSATKLVVESQFSADFTSAQIVKQNQEAQIYLDAPVTQGLAVEIGQGVRYPDTHFSIKVYFNNSLVVNVGDASLDPNDEYFVEPLVAQSNSVDTGTAQYQQFVTVQNLWTSTYTTNPETDVRPCNGSGIVLNVDKSRIYTVADMDYSQVVTNLLYPNPYTVARSFFRIKKAVAPIVLQGTISSIGTAVTGTDTEFLTQCHVGDYLYDPNTSKVRKIRAILSDTSLLVDTVFPNDIPALTVGTIAGYIQVDQGYDLSLSCRVGDRFLVTYPQQLTKGYDGDNGHLIPYYYTKFADPDRNHLENAAFGYNYGLIRIAIPGNSGLAEQKAWANYASLRAYEFRCEIPSYYSDAASAEAYVDQELGRNDFITVSFPSYGYISNPFGSGDRLISLSGDIMGGESAYAVANLGYHHPFAGLSAILSRVLRLPFNAVPADEAILNVAGIQTIKPLDGNIVVFGARTPSLTTTYDFTHIRRIQSNFVRLFLEARNFLELLFLPNQPGLAQQLILILSAFALNEYRKGVFTQYLQFDQAVAIAGDDVNVNTAEGRNSLVSIINGKLNIYFRYVPTGILEVLSINAGPDIVVESYGKGLLTANN